MNNRTELSVVIRTFNEQKWLPSVLKSIRNQSIGDIEVIIVDSGSTDETLEIAEEFSCQTIKIRQNDFTYPYALNIGITQSSGDIIGILSGHSVPVSNKWATNGLNHFKNTNVAGVSGPIQALPDANLIEKTYYSFNTLLWYLFPRLVLKHKSLDNRNSMIRKSDWGKYNFDEKQINGSEDFDWAQYMIHKQNKKVLYDSKFQAKHSHSGIGKPIDLVLWPKWRKVNKPIKKRYKQ